MEIDLLNEKDFCPFFIYSKNGKCKVLHFKQAAKHHNDLLKAKWKHTGTIEPLHWIQGVLNDDKVLTFLNEYKQ
jgi:hypothetical protein